MPVVDIKGMRGAARAGARAGDDRSAQRPLDLGRQEVAIDGPVRVNGPDDYHVETRDVTVDLKVAHHAAATARSRGR